MRSTIPPDLTLGEAADLEEREASGDKLSPEDRATLVACCDTIRPLHARMAPGLSLVQQTAKAVSASIGATVTRWREQYREEFAYIDSLPPWKRKRYEHMTMPEVRRAMRRSAAAVSPSHSSPARVVRRDSHRMRPGHRRSGATSTTASADPGDPEPASSRGVVVL